MRIDISDIPDEGLTLDVEEEGENLAALAGALDFTFRSPISAHLEITGAESGIVTSGVMNAILGFSCARCLKEFDFPVSSEFRLFCTTHEGDGKEKESSEGDEEEEGVEVDPDEPSSAHVYGTELDVTELLLEQIALEAPMQPLCSDGCKGLCPMCGADLNVAKCSCKDEARIDPRFSKLKDFKAKQKK